MAFPYRRPDISVANAFGVRKMGLSWIYWHHPEHRLGKGLSERQGSRGAGEWSREQSRDGVGEAPCRPRRDPGDSEQSLGAGERKEPSLSARVHLLACTALSNANGENAVSGKCSLINNIKSSSLSAGDIPHFSSQCASPRHLMMWCSLWDVRSMLISPLTKWWEQIQPGSIILRRQGAPNKYIYIAKHIVLIYIYIYLSQWSCSCFFFSLCRNLLKASFWSLEDFINGTKSK